MLRRPAGSLTVMPYEVSTPVYEGPFDLLLHLITREEVDLWEISLVTFPMLPGAGIKGLTEALSQGERERGLAVAIRQAAARLRRHPSTHRQPTRTR